VFYHGLSAHWVLALVIEKITGVDFRQAVQEMVLKPLGLEEDLFMGLPAQNPSVSQKVAYLYEPQTTQFKPLAMDAAKDRASTCAHLAQSMKLREESHDTVWQEAGVPGGGAYGTAKGMALLYQMMVQGGVYRGVRFLSEKTLAYAIQNYTGERVDEMMGLPMHRGLGPHLRGQSVHVRGLGTLSGPGVFGHGGVGTSYAWADPERKFSFAYITNTRLADPWHSKRLESVSNQVQLAFK
jgi:CubicO group peptidase (beta-lactamase class C family)